jgi:hypothetical protein
MFEAKSGDWLIFRFLTGHMPLLLGGQIAGQTFALQLAENWGYLVMDHGY